MTIAEQRATVRCSLTAQARGDELLATAGPAKRFLLLEVPGAWLPESMAASGLGPRLTRSLRIAAAAAGARMLLIRRPGRHPAQADQVRRWAIATVATPGLEQAGLEQAGLEQAGPEPARPEPAGAEAAGLLWGDWRTATELLSLDLAARLPPFDSATQRPVALVCTHGRHDLCCAIEGRPVVAAAATDPALDVWECSHLGGDRFAANLLWLPSGLLFGGLGPDTTPAVLAAAHQGRVLLDHYRGRSGDSQPAQAAQWYLMRALREDRPDRVEVERMVFEPSTPGLPSDQDGSGVSSMEDDVTWVVVLRHGSARYRLRLGQGWTEPGHLTCRAPGLSRARRYRLLGPVLKLG